MAEAAYKESETPRADVELFLTNTELARQESEKCRDYFDHKQWTEAEAAKLRGRKQAPIVVNRVKPKVEGLCGLYNMRKTDPIAYPRTQAHEEAAHVVTDGLRYVADNVQFDRKRVDVAQNFFVEGYGGAVIGVRRKPNGEMEVTVSIAPWDRIYFDPHSREYDFSDASYIGVMIWMNEDEFKRRFPRSKASFDDCLSQHEYGGDETFKDRPQWIDEKQRRVRVAWHFQVTNGKWEMCYFCGDQYIVPPQVSPFLDDEGLPTCIIELVSAHIDRDNNRYGEVKTYLDQQDEINHRRSKALHFFSQRQTYSRRGAVDDVNKLKRELAKPDGHVEFEGDEFGKDFGVMPTGDMGTAQFNMYQDSKSELDAVSFNAQLSGERQQGDLSGRAIEKLQAAGTIELNRQYGLLSDWENRVYRQIWARIKQFWNEEKWIRVTDDKDDLRWVGFNHPMTVQQRLEEEINDESLDLQTRQSAAALYTRMITNQDPRLQEIIEVRNPVAELDMDIIIEQSFDVINAQQEQFEMLAKFATSGDVDILDLIELSNLRDKDKLIDKIEKRRQQAMEANQAAMQTDMADKQSKVEKTQAETTNIQVDSIQKQLENELMINRPDQVRSVV